MLDCGVDKVYISSNLSCHWPYLEIPLPATPVRLLDGTMITSTKGISIPYKIGSLAVILTARVLDLKGYDIILGME